MSVGKRDGIRPADIVGSIANEADIPGRDIGPIEILDEVTYVGVPERHVEHVLEKVGRAKFRGHPVNLKRAEGGAPRRPPAPRREFAPRREGPPRRDFAPRDDRPPRPRREFAPRDAKPAGPRREFAPRGDKPTGPRREFAPRDDKPARPRREFAPREGAAPRKPFVRSRDDRPAGGGAFDRFKKPGPKKPKK